jgi:hypothetical protein
MMIRRISLYPAAPLALFLAISAGACAETTMLTLNLSGKAEVPPTTTAATGKGLISVQDDHLVKGTIDVSGIEPTMAHIHEGATGENGPPIVTLVMDDKDTFSVPQDTKLTEDQYKSFVAGKLYVNVHSAAHPSGEIRAQLIKQP